MSANPPIDLLAIAEERVRDTEAAMWSACGPDAIDTAMFRHMGAQMDLDAVRLFALEVGV